MTARTQHYFPPFLWDFWLAESRSAQISRVHSYDIYDNELLEIHEAPSGSRPVFQDFDDGTIDPETRKVLSDAHCVFSQLEGEVKVILQDLKGRTQTEDCKKKSLPFNRLDVETLRKYFIFLRFRNSSGYQNILQSLDGSVEESHQGGILYSVYRPLIADLRRRYILREFMSFLQHRWTDSPRLEPCAQPVAGAASDAFRDAMDVYCWRLCGAEICVGMATDDQEFVLSDCCFGTLDEGFEEDPQCCDLFFPFSPTLALYVLGTANEHYPSSSVYRQTERSTVWIDIGFESASDVHLRNAMILQTYPHHLYFSSLRTVALSISSYDEFRWIQEHQDYSRLKQRCRQKFLQETVTKTLVVKGSLILTDLTDEVEKLGESAVCHGSFSDVWKGVWNDPVERRTRVVALKFLRQVMVQNVRAKLLKRLQAEVVAWHRLCHRNVSQLFGVFQAANGIAMVSPWCENGTICSYLANNPSADRLKLLCQVASGISYLHSVQPVVVHGDLKGGNILIDEHGCAIITDFGLSKVIEEMSDSLNVGTSFFAGSTRWMAPELVQALIEDDGTTPPITTYSDVYAFASICLEVATGELPYPHRKNDHAVILDIMRGVKPSRGASKCYISLKDEGIFWEMLDNCWTQAFCLRPTMSQMLQFLESL